VRLTPEEYRRLVEAGVLGKVELLDGVVYMSKYELAFSAAQVRDAATVGVTLPSPVDLVLSDPELRREATARLRDYGAPSAPSDTDGAIRPPQLGDDAVARLVEHLHILGPPSSWEAAVDYDSLALAIIDSVWSIGVRYVGVLNVLDRYRRLRREKGADAERDTPAHLVDCIQQVGGPIAFADAVANRQRTSSRNGILKAEAVCRQAANVRDAGAETPAQLAALDDVRLEELRAAWVAVPGQGSGLSWSYFLMLARMPGVKADRMVRRFVAAALGRPGEQAVSAAQAARLVTAAAEQIGVEDRVLDYAIWRYQSTAAR
jgi:hypothetical protein